MKQAKALDLLLNIPFVLSVKSGIVVIRKIAKFIFRS